MGMSEPDNLKRLEASATKAEQLIAVLRKSIQEIKSGPAFGSEIKRLEAENQELRSQIQEWKVRLCQAETGNGVQQVAEPTKTKSSEATPVKKEESSAKPKESKPADSKEKPAKAKKEPKPKKPQQPAEELPVHIGRLDLRVGLIRTAKKHPDADGLYVEEVDVGEEKPRTVISGLVKFIPEAEMQNRLAVLLCNLKPAKMRGIMSEAMVMCASTPDKVEILSPPADSKPGDLVTVEGFDRCADAQLNPKKKIFEAVAPDLKVNEAKEATYKGIKWSVNGKNIVSQTLTNVIIK